MKNPGFAYSALAAGPSGDKAAEIASLTQTVATEKAKLDLMQSMNPMLIGKAID